MTPARFRDEPRLDQVEMMAHRREYNLRKAHESRVTEIIAEDEAKKKKPAKR